MEPPSVVRELVERFKRDQDSYTSPSYNETNTRIDFIDRLFEEGLGWDVRNLSGASRAYKDVIHGDSIKVSGVQKAPDYCFRIGGTRKFFLEAKKPSVVIKDDPEAAFQLRRYAWSAKLPLSILTNFREFAVYDCRTRPKRTDKAAFARNQFWTYEEYLTDWEKIAQIFSKQAVLTGSFDTYSEAAKDKKGTSEVDKEFLTDIERWRDELARNIALRNTRLGVPELNFAVQRTIDRIIFLRMCEDRGIERYGQLKELTDKSGIYTKLLDIFECADEKYNSGIFHFHKERGRLETPDEITPQVRIDDAILSSIIGSLYYPESPYEFSVLPATILGSVYEQFLGKVIRLTSGHHAKVEEKPDVKKAGGVYYTPEYVVDYIVKGTVGELIRDKAPEQVEKMRILDSSCGSGSFLLGAYTLLLDYHLDWYASHKPAKQPRALYRSSNGDWKLTTYEKKRILLNNIFGVDIDPQAVEVTKLNLLLKVLEDENQESLERQQKIWKERALPDLAGNIKCGNSLIVSDFYRSRPQTDFSGNEVFRINAFDWDREFDAVMAEGGFDAVIGNPPWGAEFSESELEYHRNKNREIIVRMIDSFMYFVHQGSQKLGGRGRLGMILPDVILYQTDNEKLRKYLLDNFTLQRIVNLGDVFEKVTRPACILTMSRMDGADIDNEVQVGNISKMRKSEKPKALADLKTLKPIKQSKILEIPRYLFVTKDPENYGLLTKARAVPHLKLSDIVDNDGIQRGVSPDLKAAFIVDRTTARKARLEKEKLRRVLTGGKQVRRFSIEDEGLLLIYTSRSDDFTNLPHICKYISDFKDQITCKEVEEKKHSLFALHRPREETIFTKPRKILGVITGDKVVAAIDENSLFATDGLYLFGLRDEHDPRYVLAILNSRLFVFLYRLLALEEGRVLAQVKPTVLGELPVRTIDAKDEQSCRRRDTLISLVERIIHLQSELHDARSPDEKSIIQRQVEGIDHEIDILVYELYNLSRDDIALIESS